MAIAEQLIQCGTQMHPFLKELEKFQHIQDFSDKIWHIIFPDKKGKTVISVRQYWYCT